MSDDTATAETWTTDAETLYRDGVAVGTLDSAGLAEWVAEACNNLADLDEAQAEWLASGEAAHCSMVDIGGEKMRLQHGAEMPEMLRDAMADVVDASRRMMAKAKAHERYEMEAHHLAEIERLKAELARRVEVDERMTELAADHVSEYAQRAADAEEWAGQLYTAWWSARIGRAKDRAAGQAWRDNCLVIGGERDQLKATVARVKALAKDMRTWCSPYGIADHYAQRIDEAIEPPEPVGIEADSEAEFAAKIGAILRKHRADIHPEHNHACANCAVIKGAPEVLTAGLDDLPAVRAFVAGFDPHEEGS